VDVSFLSTPPKKKRIGIFLPLDNPERAHLMEIAYEDGGRKCIFILILRVTELL
jgi:hypothetical protein